MNSITDKRIDKVKDCIQNSKTIVLAAFECIELCLAAIAIFLLLSVSYPEFVSFLLRPFSELSAISFAEFIKSYGWIFGAGIKYILIAGLSLVIIHNSGCLLFIYTCRRGCKFIRHCHFALFFFLLIIWFATLCLAGYWLYWLIIGIIKSGFNYNIWQVIIFPLLSLVLMLCYLWHSLFYHRDIVSIMKHLEKEITSGRLEKCNDDLDRIGNNSLMFVILFGIGAILLLCNLYIIPTLIAVLLSAKYLYVYFSFNYFKSIHSDIHY